ncbi:uncharacterized protein LOC126833269 [Adelges cooleyi]|uniref:uncharacterized protein LOC126833269 n=1 Tax=Adelges cooleyi TaxID=133065 RepID=UPI00217FB4B4|nr:uncharacterized protein LOC126833269 [Adelges cooleyi]
MQCEIFEEIPKETVEYFCEQVLKRQWPDSIHPYYFIKTGLKWNNKNAASVYKFYYISNDIESGIFIGTYLQPEEHLPDIVVTYTNPGNEEKFQRVLQNTKVINWQKEVLFQAVLARLSDIVESTILEKNMKCRLYAESLLKWMSASEATKIEVKVPDGVTVRRLDKDHVDFIYSQWAHSDVYSKFDIVDTVNLNFGLGVFGEENNDPLAWAMCGSYGGLSTLVVRPECRRRGFGKTIANAITKEMGERGISPHAIINRRNVVSLNLFDVIGFSETAIPVTYLLARK